jgi:hypothetical protein
MAATSPGRQSGDRISPNNNPFWACAKDIFQL